MRHYLTNQHFARITAPGWDARILTWHRDGAEFILHKRYCSLIRHGSGFIPTLNCEPLCDQPQIPDSALAYIWRAIHN